MKASQERKEVARVDGIPAVWSAWIVMAMGERPPPPPPLVHVVGRGRRVRRTPARAEAPAVVMAAPQPAHRGRVPHHDVG